MTRILNVIRSVNPQHGGVAEGLRQYAMRVQELGHDYEVLTLDAPSDDWVKKFPAPTHAVGPVGSKYGYCPGLVGWLRSHAHDYDAVVIHGLWQYHSFATWRALRGGKTPYYVFPHGMLDPWFRRTYPLKHLKKWLYWPWADYRVVRDARSVLFTTEEEMRLAPQSFSLYRANSVLAGFGLAVDAVGVEAQEAKFFDAYPDLQDKHFVLFLARIHPKKGCDLLVEAFARIATQFPSLHLVMAGPDPDGLQPALEARARAAGVAERITWTGMLTGDLKWGALEAAEVFILPSHQENFGIAVAEALAVGTPVLISQQVNIWREIIADDAGYAADDTVEGAETLLELWGKTDVATRERMSTNARLCFRRHFHIEAAADRFVEIVNTHVGAATA